MNKRMHIVFFRDAKLFDVERNAGSEKVKVKVKMQVMEIGVAALQGVGESEIVMELSLRCCRLPRCQGELTTRSWRHGGLPRQGAESARLEADMTSHWIARLLNAYGNIVDVKGESDKLNNQSFHDS